MCRVLALLFLIVGSATSFTLHRAVGSCAGPALYSRLLPAQMSQRKGGLLGAVDDILDYLTNMGGYTGFTEDELKGGNVDLNRRDMSEFGRPTEVDNNVTTAFVIALIAFPSIVGLIAVSIYGAPAIFTFAAKDAGT